MRRLATLAALLALALAAVLPAPVLAVRTCDVTSYGADPTGVNDAVVQINAAISDCSTSAGNTVYFPLGTYKLSQNDNKQYDFTIKTGSGVYPSNVLGARRDQTTLKQYVGNGTAVGCVQATGSNGPKGILSVTADGVSVTKLGFDTATCNAGNAVRTGANNTIFDHLKVHAGGNPNVFAVRFNGPCTHLNRTLMNGNQATNLLIDDLGTGGNDALDFSCQNNGLIQNIQLTGSYTALYIVSNVQVLNFTFTPGPQQSPRGWYITGPSDHISIDGFFSSGLGGIIGNSLGDMTTDVTINNQQMTGSDPAAETVFDNAQRVTVTNSTLKTVALRPSVLADDITLTTPGTTWTGVVCAPSGGTISNLHGFSCP